MKLQLFVQFSGVMVVKAVKLHAGNTLMSREGSCYSHCVHIEIDVYMKSCFIAQTEENSFGECSRNDVPGDWQLRRAPPIKQLALLRCELLAPRTSGIMALLSQMRPGGTRPILRHAGDVL